MYYLGPWSGCQHCTTCSCGDLYQWQTNPPLDHHHRFLLMLGGLDFIMVQNPYRFCVFLHASGQYLCFYTHFTLDISPLPPPSSAALLACSVRFPSHPYVRSLPLKPTASRWNDRWVISTFIFHNIPYRFPLFPSQSSSRILARQGLYLYATCFL